MAASDLTNVAFIVKRVYANGCAELAMRDHPFYSEVPKAGGFTGGGFFYSMRYSNPQSVGGSFAQIKTDSETAQGASSGKQLQLSRKKKYGRITLDGEAMMAARGDKAAFMDLVTGEVDGVIYEHGDALAFELYRDGTGARGRIATGGVAGNVITLDNADDARNFKVNMVVKADDTATGASPRAGTTYVTVVDEDLGKITLANAAGITATAGDYLFRAGDTADVAPNGVIEGLALNIPLTAPVLASDSFRGIDRGSDPRRLAGVRVDDTATSIEENIGLVAVKISQVGKKADRCYLNPVKFWEVVRRQNGKVTYSGGGSATYGFRSFDLDTPAGTVKLVADPDCPTTRGYVLKLDTWKFKTLGECPHVYMDDEMRMLRLADSDAVEMRTRSMGNLYTTEPAANGVFSIA